MRNFIIVTILVLFAVINIVNAEDIRNAKWGMTVEEVVEAEDAQSEVVESQFGTSVECWVSLLGKQAQLEYDFSDDNLLISARYLVRLYGDFYPEVYAQKIRTILIKKYGNINKSGYWIVEKRTSILLDSETNEVGGIVVIYYRSLAAYPMPEDESDKL